MKLTSRGFTLVELMIVIAIIGILAAALFPSLTSYLASARDSGRVSNLRSIKVAAASYFTNNSSYSGLVTATNCVNSGALLQYMSNKVPTDPNATRNHGGCGANGNYAAGTGQINLSEAYVMFAGLESSGKGNTGAVTMSVFNGTPDVVYIQNLKTGGSNTGFLDVQ